MNGIKFYEHVGKDYTFRGYVTMDEMRVRGNVLASGDNAEDKRAEDEVIARMEDGDTWAWACVTIVCEHNRTGIKGSDSLGGCSYADAKDFMRPKSYFTDMVHAAREACQDEIARVRKGLCNV